MVLQVFFGNFCGVVLFWVFLGLVLGPILGRCFICLASGCGKSTVFLSFGK